MDDGFLIINKPTGFTSFSCVSYIRRIIGKAKVGHSGTLDKSASGLIILGIGRTATRMMSSLLHCDKEYIAQGKLGELTDTFDGNGKVIKTCSNATTTEQDITNALKTFGTSYEQIPPAYSALQYNGVRLYQLAQKKNFPQQKLDAILQKKKRRIYLHNLVLNEFAFPYFTIQAHVSHGTYIRSLINDIAQKLNSCATTVLLQRTIIGPFSLKQAIDLKKIETVEDIQRYLIAVDEFEKIINPSLNKQTIHP